MSINPTALSNLKAKQKEAETDQTANVVTEKKKEKVFNVYISTMLNHKLIRTDGKTIHVLNGKCITADKKDIEYLDAEIEAGFPYLKKAEQLTSTELDPMAGLRAQMKEEARRELLAEQLVADRDMGLSESKVKPTSTAELDVINAGSNTTK